MAWNFGGWNSRYWVSPLYYPDSKQPLRLYTSLCPNFGDCYNMSIVFLSHFGIPSSTFPFQIYQIVMLLTNWHILALLVAILGFKGIFVFCIRTCHKELVVATSSSYNNGWCHCTIAHNTAPTYTPLEDKHLLRFLKFVSIFPLQNQIMLSTLH